MKGEINILLVDDEHSLLDQANIFLGKVERLNVTMASSAKKGLELLDKEDFDVIVSDYQMPEIDGLDFLEEVRNKREMDIPFIMFTGKGREEVAMKALNLGADRYLRKGGDTKSQYGVLAQAVAQEVEHHRSKIRAKELEALKSTIRGVNQVLSRSRSMKKASREICEILLKTKGYLEISMALQEDSVIKPVASFGDHGRKEWEAKVDSTSDLRSQDIPECFQEVLETGEKLIIESKRESDYCAKCEFCLYEEDHSSIKLPLDIENRKAFMSICLDVERLNDEEIGLIREVANDIQHAFRRIDVEDELERVSSMVTQSTEAMILTDSDFCITYMNPAAEEMYGFTLEEVEGKTPEIFNAELESEKIQEEISEKVSEMETYQNVLLNKRKDDSKFYCETKISPIFHENIEGYVGFHRDVTDRIKKERALKESEERYRRLFETAYDGMLIIDAKSGKIKDANPHLQDIIGYGKEELVGKRLWEIGTFKDIAENKKRFQELVEEGLIRYEDLPLKTKNGEEVPVEFLSNTYDVGEEKVVQCNIREVGERKEAEERQEFLHSILRHDVRNKIQVAKGHVQLMKEENEDYSDEIMKTIKSAEEIIEKVSILQKVETCEEIEEIVLNDLIDQVICEYEEQARKKDITLEVQDLSCKVKGSPLLSTLFGNLIENSIQHGVCEKIKISGEMEGENCLVTVEDDGKGIPDEIKEKIFERGYKKGKNAGSGLGMYLAKEIANSYDGNVEVKDSDMGGVGFEVRLNRG